MANNKVKFIRGTTEEYQALSVKDPDVLYIITDESENSDIINEYFIEFTTSSSGTTISLPSTIKWANGETPTFEANTTYQISIVNNLGVVITFK